MPVKKVSYGTLSPDGNWIAFGGGDENDKYDRRNKQRIENIRYNFREFFSFHKNPYFHAPQGHSGLHPDTRLNLLRAAIQRKRPILNNTQR